MKKGICKNGHLIEGNNAYERKDGSFACKICTLARARKRRMNPVLYAHDLQRMKVNYNLNKEERNLANKARWNRNKELYNKQQRDSFPEKLRKLKTEVLTYYGNGKLSCVCCGENQIVFLTLDHINGREEGDRGWNKNKKVGRVLWAWVKKQGYPKGYQTSCWNCNSGRQINKGICPHKQRETIPVELTNLQITRI